MELQTIETLLDDLRDYLRAHDGDGLPQVQRGVLYACLRTANVSYRQMPKLLLDGNYGHYSEKNLKNAGSSIFQRLSVIFDEDIKKNNCHHKLLSWYRSWQKQVAATPVQANSARDARQPVPANLLKLHCWKHDVDELVNRIRGGRRIICITGAACVGKTYLTHALVEQIEPDFDQVIRCQAADVQTTARLYAHVLKHDISKQTAVGIHDKTPDEMAIAALSDLLHTQRILLVIDHTKILFQPQTLAGEFRRDCKGYETWLKRLLASPFISGCLILVGREPPKCFDVPPALCHTVSRLQTDDAAIFLAAQDTFDTPITAIAGWEKLVKFCGGNPMWLLRQAFHLQRLSPQGIPGFLANPLLDLNVEESLHRGLTRLSDVEQLLLLWLLLKPISYEHVRYLDIPGVLSQDLMNALASLERRDLIWHDTSQRYQLDSPLLERVVANHVVEQISAELSGAPLAALVQSPLFHGAASASRQRWQQQYLLQAAVNEFQRNSRRLPSEQTQRLRELLEQIRRFPVTHQGYAISNVLNVAIALDIPLTEFDINGLHLRHVDLRSATLQGANLEDCTFENTLLPLNLTGKLAADMTSDARAIAVGDADGHLFYWQREEDALRLHAFYTLSTPVDKLLFQETGTLILVSNQDVYSWWVGGGGAPQKIIELPDSAHCLAHSHWGHIAIGLTNGQIILWDEMKQKKKILNAHANPVCNLAFSPDGCSLASIGLGNRVLIWNLIPGDGVALSYRELSSGSRICVALGWDHDTLVRAEVEASHIYLRAGSSLTRERNIADGHVITLHFSKSGYHLAGSSNSGLIFCWEWQTQALSSIKQSTVGTAGSTNGATYNGNGGSKGISERYIPGQLTVCEQGRWLLALPDRQIQLYDLQNCEILWEAYESSSKCSSCNLRSTQNLTSAERQLMRSLGADLSN